MARLQWDVIGERLYELGTSKGVLFKQDLKGATTVGVPWSGLQAVKQAPEGAEITPIYADNIQYAGIESSEKFKGTIEAFMYPDEFMECDGTREVAPGVYVGQQGRVPFSLAYRTEVGSDTAGISYGYKLHFVWNARVTPSAKDYTTIGETPEAAALSWGFDTTAVDPGIEGLRPMAYFVVDSNKVSTGVMAKLEAIIYGTDGEGSGNGEPSRMPTLQEVINIAKGEGTEEPTIGGGE